MHHSHFALFAAWPTQRWRTIRHRCQGLGRGGKPGHGRQGSCKCYADGQSLKPRDKPKAKVKLLKRRPETAVVVDLESDEGKDQAEPQGNAEEEVTKAKHQATHKAQMEELRDRLKSRGSRPSNPPFLPSSERSARRNCSFLM